MSINAARGDATYVFDMRATKFMSLGSTDRKVGLFAEFFNLFNTAIATPVQARSRSIDFTKEPACDSLIGDAEVGASQNAA